MRFTHRQRFMLAFAILSGVAVVVIANGIGYPAIGIINDCKGLEYIDPAKSPEAGAEYLERGMICIDAALEVHGNMLIAFGFSLKITVIVAGFVLLWLYRRTGPAT